MALSPGTRLGPYEVIAAVGAGGMGEVYRGRDIRLNRTVAIKVLPDAVGRDPDRLARFEREARTLATLNHPNIAQIYGLEQHALAMEFEIRGIPFAREAPLRVDYKGQTLECTYKVDFVCFDDLLVELKALAALTNVETAIVLNYLKASGLERALLINFGAASLQHKRLVWSRSASGNPGEIDPQIYTD